MGWISGEAFAFLSPKMSFRVRFVCRENAAKWRFVSKI
jgi:hypothetical protein